MCYRVDLHMRGWALPGISCSDQGTRQMLGREPGFMNSAWTTFPGQKEQERERRNNSKEKKSPKKWENNSSSTSHYLKYVSFLMQFMSISRNLEAKDNAHMSASYFCFVCR